IDFRTRPAITGARPTLVCLRCVWRGKPMTYRDMGAEPALYMPSLASIYEKTSVLSWPLIRIAAGAFLLTHGWPKLFNMGVQAFAANSLAKRGIEPSLLFAYIVIF